MKRGVLAVLRASKQWPGNTVARARAEPRTESKVLEILEVLELSKLDGNRIDRVELSICSW